MRVMLGKRLDGLKLLLAARSMPVGLEIHAVQLCPFGHEALLVTRQRAGDHVPVEVDRRRLSGIARMEVGLGVVRLVPVHVDRDPVEEADPRHSLTVRSRPALDVTL